MIKEYINQYEYDRDYEMYDNDVYVFNVEDVEDEIIKKEITSLYKEYDEYTEQKSILDDKLATRPFLDFPSETRAGVV